MESDPSPIQQWRKQCSGTAPTGRLGWMPSVPISSGESSPVTAAAQPAGDTTPGSLRIQPLTSSTNH